MSLFSLPAALEARRSLSGLRTLTKRESGEEQRWTLIAEGVVQCGTAEHAWVVLCAFCLPVQTID